MLELNVMVELLSTSLLYSLGVVNATILSGFPCKDFTGYCDDNRLIIIHYQ